MAKGDRNSGWTGFFRAFTVLCAIILLLAQRYLDLTAPGAGARQVLSVCEGLTLWTVPALFLLWGMFSLEEGKPQVSASLLGLALPAFCLLVFWGVVYAVVSALLEGGLDSTAAGLWAILTAVIKGDTYFHLWVLYPLIGLYLVHPVLHRFTSAASRGELHYFLGLCVLFASILPLWTAFRPNGAIALLLMRFGVHLVLGWAGCYVAGWYLRHFEISRAAEFILYILGILGLVLTLIGDGLTGGSRELWRQYSAPNVALTAAAFCVLFRYVLGISEERSRRRAVNRIGTYAFGAYLIHQLWYLIFRWCGVGLLSFPPVCSVPVFALVFFLLSLPFAWLISLIPGIGPRLT